MKRDIVLRIVVGVCIFAAIGALICAIIIQSDQVRTYQTRADSLQTVIDTGCMISAHSKIDSMENAQSYLSELKSK